MGWSRSQKLQSQVLFRFSLELVENDMRKNYHWTNELVFKTAAVAKVVNLDARRITVGYRWDPVKHVSDLKQASIKIPKSLIQNSNCLDYIQVGIVIHTRTNTYVYC